MNPYTSGVAFPRGACLEVGLHLLDFDTVTSMVVRSVGKGVGRGGRKSPVPGGSPIPGLSDELFLSDCAQSDCAQCDRGACFCAEGFAVPMFISSH